MVFNNSISSGAGYALGIFEQNQLRGNGFDSIAGFQLTATDGSLLNLRVDGNSVSNYRGEDLDSDGELDAGADTSRCGPRLVTGLEIMAEMIHPELFSGMIPESAALRLFGDLTKTD